MWRAASRGRSLSRRGGSRRSPGRPTARRSWPATGPAVHRGSELAEDPVHLRRGRAGPARSHSQPGIEANPKWSPDGKMIVYDAYTENSEGSSLGSLGDECRRLRGAAAADRDHRGPAGLDLQVLGRRRCFRWLQTRPPKRAALRPRKLPPSPQRLAVRPRPPPPVCRVLSSPPMRSTCGLGQAPTTRRPA